MASPVDDLITEAYLTIGHVGVPAIQRRVWAVHNVRVSGNKVRKIRDFMGMGPSNRPNLNSQPSNGEPAPQGPEHGAPDPQDSLAEEPAPEVSNFGSYFFPFLLNPNA